MTNQQHRKLISVFGEAIASGRANKTNCHTVNQTRWHRITSIRPCTSVSGDMDLDLYIYIYVHGGAVSLLATRTLCISEIVGAT